MHINLDIYCNLVMVINNSLVGMIRHLYCFERYLNDWIPEHVYTDLRGALHFRCRQISPDSVGRFE